MKYLLIYIIQYDVGTVAQNSEEVEFFTTDFDEIVAEIASHNLRKGEYTVYKLEKISD